MSPDDLLTTQEVADLLRTTPSTLRHWRYTGTGPVGVRIGKRVLYRRHAVEAWVESLERRERHLRAV